MKLGCSFFWKDAGFFSLWGTDASGENGWAFHFLLKKQYWTWGIKQYWHDGEVTEFGFGPFFKFVVCVGWR